MQETVNSDKNLCKTGSVVRIPQLLQTKQTERLQSIFANSSICQLWHIGLFLSRFARKKWESNDVGTFVLFFLSLVFFGSIHALSAQEHWTQRTLYSTELVEEPESIVNIIQ